MRKRTCGHPRLARNALKRTKKEGCNLPKESIVYVGRKPPMNYVLAVMAGFGASDTKAVTLKARGRAISTAVDVAEISRRRFLNDVKVDRIIVGGEDLPIEEENRVKTVSTIEITLKRTPRQEEEIKKETEKSEVASIRSLELSSIKGIGKKRAEKLKSCGVHSIKNLANFNPKTLSEKLQISKKRVSKWINEAKETLNNK